MAASAAYLPIDRYFALSRGEDLPDRATGAALVADISGFTSFAEALAHSLGPLPGAEELIRRLNGVYDRLVRAVHRFGGSVVSFSGDALTCWFDGDSGARALAAGLAMQRALTLAEPLVTAEGRQTLSLKVVVAPGSARRFRLGDPAVQLFDVLAGAVLDRLTAAEAVAAPGEVLLVLPNQAGLGAGELAAAARVVAWRTVESGGGVCALVSSLRRPVSPAPWPALPAAGLPPAVVRPWLLPVVATRLETGQGALLTELRPATALFVRFGGLDWDGDDAGAHLAAYIRWVQGMVAAYEGTLLQITMGEKGCYLYAAFGAPVAHENDPERAARVALALAHPPAHLGWLREVGIGIAGGQMRTGAYGAEARCTYGVQGDAVNLAARLMSAAGPGEILAGRRTQAATAALGVWEPAGVFRLKGKAALVPVFRLLGIHSAPVAPLHEPADGLPMVGRGEEVARAGALLEGLALGEGHILCISGEAGIGKSRLVAEILRLATARSLRGVVGACQSHGTTSSYLVWRPIWQTLLGLDAAGSLEEQTRRLTQTLAGTDAGMVERMPLLGAVLGLPIPDTDLTRSLDARLRKGALEALLVEVLRALAAQTPLVLVLEDCHWIDTLSRDLLEMIGRAAADLPVVLVPAYRPLDAARAEGWRLAALPHASAIVLGELPQEEAVLLAARKLRHLFGDAGGAQTEDHALLQVAERLAARAQGNPFFVDELVTLLHERGVDPHDPEAAARLELPVSLHSLLLSRIDALRESERSTLRVASVVGREFRAGWLWGVYPPLGTPDAVRADLEALDRLDLTPLQGTEPEPIYLFKHILTQESAYAGLAEETRAALHEGCGRFLALRYEDSLDGFTDQIAHHFARSRADEDAAIWLERAGDKAAAAYANEAAIASYEQARARIERLGAGHDERLSRLDEKLGSVRLVASDFAQAGADFARARRQTQDAMRQANILVKEAKCWELLGEHQRALAAYTEAAAVDATSRRGSATADPFRVASLEIDRAGLYFRQREIARTEEAIRGALSVLEGHPDHMLRAWAEAMLGNVALVQGRLADAENHYERGRQIAQRRADDRCQAVTIHNLGIVALQRGEYQRAMDCFQAGLQLEERLGSVDGIADSLDTLGELHRIQGAFDQAEAHYRRALALRDQTGNSGGAAVCWLGRAEVAADRGHWLEVDSYAAHVLAIGERIGDHQVVAMALRVQGQALRARGDLALARTTNLRSLETWERIGDRWHETRPLLELGHVACARGDWRQARSLFGRARHAAREMHLAADAVDTYLGSFEAALGAGRLHAAAAFLRRIDASLAALELPPLATRAARAHGELSLREGVPSDAHTAAQSALRLAHNLGQEHEEALARRLLGRCALAEGDRADAVATLRQALASFDALGARFEAARTQIDLAEALMVQAAGAGMPAEAARLLGEARNTCREAGAAADLARADGFAAAWALDGEPALPNTK